MQLCKEPFRRLLQQWDQLLTVNGVLYRQFLQAKKGQAHLQLVVPVGLRTRIVRDVHEGVAGGHQGHDKILNRLKEQFYWPEHYNDVRDWCQTCATCATRKTSAHSSKSPLGTITASYPIQIMAVDLVGSLPESKKGNCYIMIVGDYFSLEWKPYPYPTKKLPQWLTSWLMRYFFIFQHQNNCIQTRGGSLSPSFK